jgi:hypothetical protein
MTDLNHIFVNFCATDSKHVMLPTGQLHVLSADPQDAKSSYQCRTLHRLTGRTKESLTAGRIQIAGEFFEESVPFCYTSSEKHTSISHFKDCTGGGGSRRH